IAASHGAEAGSGGGADRAHGGRPAQTGPGVGRWAGRRGARDRAFPCLVALFTAPGRRGSSSVLPPPRRAGSAGMRGARSVPRATLMVAPRLRAGSVSDAVATGSDGSFRSRLSGVMVVFPLSLATPGRATGFHPTNDPNRRNTRAPARPGIVPRGPCPLAR